MLTVLLSTLLVFFVTGAPIFFAILIASLTYILLSDFSSLILVERISTGIDSFPLLAVPFFILAAQIMNRTGVSERIFDFALAIVGHVKGGLGHVNVVASIIFAGMSGSSTADVAGLGTIEVQSMKREGYSPELSAAITAASSTIGPIVPPSVGLIIYGLMAGVSVGRLFLAGIIPGLLMGLGLMLVIYWLAATCRVDCPTRRKASLNQLWKASKRAFFPILAPLIILGSILSGIVTPTEAGVLAVLYALFLGLIYRELHIKDIPRVFIDAFMANGVLMAIISATMIFSWIVTIENVGSRITTLLTSFTDSQIVILILLNIALLIMGLFVEGVSILIITVPILVPLLNQIGVDLVQFGVILILNCMIGFLTPPVGIGIYISTAIAKADLRKVIRLVMWFLIPLIIVLLLITYVPALTLWLPGIVFDV